MNRIWFRTDLGQMEKFVALALADTADDFGECYPAVGTIALKCSCSERSVQNAIKSLCERGFLKKVERLNRSNLYEFQLDLLPLMDRPRRQKERRIIDEMTGESPAPHRRVTGESGASTGESRSMTGESPAPRTIIEPSEEQESSPTPNGVGPLRTENEIDLFRESTGQATAQPKGPSLAEHVEARWRELKLRHPGIASIRKIDDGLKRLIELRGKEHALQGQHPHDVWDDALAAVERSSFLQGRAPPGPNRSAPFRLSLPWLARIQSFRDVIGGKYEDDGHQSNYCEIKGRRLSPAEQAGNQALARLLGVEQQPSRRRDQGDDHRTIEGSFIRSDEWGAQ